MRHQVIFDTNSVRSAESFSDFLGGRSELERFMKLAEIIIPDLVLEEIKCQKKKQLHSKKDSFLSNPFHYLLDLNRETTEGFDMDGWIEELLKTEKIPHKIISLTKNKSEILETMKRLCLTGTAPFEEGSDKGFKDAYIYFTILEYINSLSDEDVFVVTKDERLRLALQKHRGIRIVKDYDEFESYNSDYFKNEYFIGRLTEVVDGDIDENCIVNISLNVDENWILRIEIDGKTYLVEVDFRSKEILSFTNEDFNDDIGGLVVSGSFSSTHAYIASLKDKTNYFSEDDVYKILLAAIQNEQIYWISTDDDVKSFIKQLYLAKSNILNEEEQKEFKEKFGDHE